MVHGLLTQALKSTGFYCILGMLGIAQAATSSSWVTQMMLSGGKMPQACAKGNPYCAARVPAPLKPTLPQFDPNQVPCDTASAPCGQAYSKQMTETYQSSVAYISPPYVPCAMQDGCAAVPAWWQSAVVQPIQKKTIPYDPGVRPWTQNKKCGTQFVGGVYVDKSCPAGTQ